MARNTVKDDVFLTPQAKNTVNRGGGRHGVGRREGAETFGYYRRPPARTRAPWPAPGFKGLRMTAGRRPSNEVWLMVWEDRAEILRANPGRAMLN